MTTLAVLQTAQRDLQAKPNSASDGRELENDSLNEEEGVKKNPEGTWRTDEQCNSNVTYLFSDSYAVCVHALQLRPWDTTTPAVTVTTN